MTIKKELLIIKPSGLTKSFKKRVKKTLNKIFGKKKKNENLNLNQNQNIIKINVGDVKKSKTKRRVSSNKKKSESDDKPDLTNQLNTLSRFNNQMFSNPTRFSSPINTSSMEELIRKLGGTAPIPAVPIALTSIVPISTVTPKQNTLISTFSKKDFGTPDDPSLYDPSAIEMMEKYVRNAYGIDPLTNVLSDNTSSSSSSSTSYDTFDDNVRNAKQNLVSEAQMELSGDGKSEAVDKDDPLFNVGDPASAASSESASAASSELAGAATSVSLAEKSASKAAEVFVKREPGFVNQSVKYGTAGPLFPIYDTGLDFESFRLGINAQNTLYYMKDVAGNTMWNFVSLLSPNQQESVKKIMSDIQYPIDLAFVAYKDINPNLRNDLRDSLKKANDTAMAVRVAARVAAKKATDKIDAGIAAAAAKYTKAAGKK